MRGKHLVWLLERIDRQRTYYINGEMLVGKELKAVGDINLYRPADFDGKVLHLHYARATVQGIVPEIRHVPARAAVDLAHQPLDAVVAPVLVSAKHKKRHAKEPIVSAGPHSGEHLIVIVGVMSGLNHCLRRQATGV